MSGSARVLFSLAEGIEEDRIRSSMDDHGASVVDVRWRPLAAGHEGFCDVDVRRGGGAVQTVAVRTSVFGGVWTDGSLSLGG